MRQDDDGPRQEHSRGSYCKRRPGRSASGAGGHSAVHRYVYLAPSERNEYAPTTRIDLNLPRNNRLSTTYLWQRIKTAPDFLMNPAVANANILRASAGTSYHALQMEYRRRLSRGLLVNASHTYSRKLESSLQTIHQPRFFLVDDERSVPHVCKLNWVYELPFGQGRRFGSSLNPVANAFLGGWELSGTGRTQIRQFTATGVKLVGMSQKDLQDAFTIRTVKNDATGVTTVYSR